MPGIVGEVLFVLALILANAVFVIAETALLSARRARLQRRADEGDVNARIALDLADTPNRFLSTVQVGITLIGILAGALGGATISHEMALTLGQVPLLKPYAEALSFGVIVVLITYFSLVLGELVPKRLALNHPERIAAAMAPSMRLLSAVAGPVVRLLSVSTEVVLRVLGVRPSQEPPVTEEEIEVLLAEGTQAGVFQAVEQDMVKSVLLLDERRASGLMTPRPDIIWLDVDDLPDEVRRKIGESPYSRLPVGQGSLDDILGEVDVRDLLTSHLAGERIDLRAFLQKPLYVPETMPALKVLEALKQSGTEMALVIDEYGSVQGLLTLKDILEAIVGDIPTAEELAEPQAVRREDGSWLLDGMLSIEEFEELFDLDEMPGDDQGLYQTLAGFVMMEMGRIPSVADHFGWEGLRFEVVDMDGPRIDKVLVVPHKPEQPHPAPEA